MTQAICHSVCLSCGFTVQTWLKDQGSTCGAYSWGPEEHYIRWSVLISSIDSMQPSYVLYCTAYCTCYIVLHTICVVLYCMLYMLYCTACCVCCIVSCRHKKLRCRYSDIADGEPGNHCIHAHSSDEAEEWKNRYSWRQMKKQRAKDRHLYSYMDALVDDIAATASNHKPVVCILYIGIYLCMYLLVLTYKNNVCEAHC